MNKEKAKTLLSCLTPIALMLLIQVVSAVLVNILIMAAAWLMSLLHINGEAVTRFLITQNVFLVSVISYGIFFFIGTAWYKKLLLFPVRKEVGEEFPDALDRRAILGIGVAAVFFQCAVTAALYLLQMTAPDLMMEYMQVMDDLGVNRPTVLSLIYVVLLAPLAEEVLMRGLCLRILRKEFSFTVANIIQALLFGIYHMNLVQGIYAFFLGLLLGALVKKYGTLKASWCCHFVINFTGQAMTFLGIGPMGVFTGTFLFGMLFLFLYTGQKRDKFRSM